MVHRLQKWISAVEVGGRFVINLDHYEYAGPGEDAAPKDLREIVRLLSSLAPEVPEDHRRRRAEPLVPDVRKTFPRIGLSLHDTQVSHAKRK